MSSDISQGVISSLTVKPTLTTLPPELYDLIFVHCNLIDLHFKLRYTNKLFYNLIPPFIQNQLRSSLLSNPSIQNYHKEVFITKNILNIRLTSKVPPFEIFPWTIKMKLCISVDFVVSMIVKVVKHYERVNKIVSPRSKWTWINC